jgi:hypothetical protein
MNIRDLLTIKITLYGRVYKTKEPKYVALSYVLGNLSEKCKDTVLHIRSHEYKWYKEGKVDKKVYQNAKESSLPAYCPSAIFGDTRIIGTEKDTTGIIVIDIDDIEDTDKAQRDVMQFPFVFIAAKSVSGNGIFCFIYYNKNNDFVRTFKALEEKFKEIGYTVDAACKDITRARYITYDDNMLVKPINQDIEMFNEMSEIEETKQTDDSYDIEPPDKETLKLLVKTIWYLVDVLDYGKAKMDYYTPFDNSHNNYVTEYKYNEWICDGFRLCSIGNDKVGLALFDKISMNAPSYNGKKDVEENFEKFKKYTKKDGNYSYYFSLAKRLLGQDWKRIIEDKYKSTNK